MKRGKLTRNAKEFAAANARSPVVEGRVTDHKNGGAKYRLKNGRTFTLDAAECRAVGAIRWDGVSA